MLSKIAHLTATSPRPSVLFRIGAWLVIGFCLLLAAMTLADAIGFPDPGSLAALVLVPWFLWLAWRQYQAAFGRKPTAARSAARMLTVIGALSGLATAAVIGETFSTGFNWFALEFVAAAATITCCAFAIARGNSRWGHCLERGIENGVLENPASGVGARRIVPVLVGGGLFAMLTAMLVGTAAPPFAEHVSASEAPFSLPANASDVSYCNYHGPASACEFQTDEASFRAWVESGIGSIESESSNTQLEEITEPHQAHRYTALCLSLGGEKSITVTDGLHYSWSVEDRGVYATYDRKTGRAYYYAHSR